MSHTYIATFITSASSSSLLNVAVGSTIRINSITITSCDDQSSSCIGVSIETKRGYSLLYFVLTEICAGRHYDINKEATLGWLYFDHHIRIHAVCEDGAKMPTFKIDMTIRDPPARTCEIQ